MDPTDARTVSLFRKIVRDLHDVDLPDDIKDIAQQAVKALGRDLTDSGETARNYEFLMQVAANHPRGSHRA
jgi:hypothetical protein